MEGYLALMLNETQITQLNEWITDTYGTFGELAHYLDLAVEMLFYVEQDLFGQRELQEVITVLYGLRRVLR
ncbi:hypothetical protein [Flagellimonas baculiformis]|uniref:hypothetical protein n=1 Tax=Flagellimonas baculiformis TaxID=3067310 RepID=UPI00296FBA86|nr:hypothetical protein [Muricauda sp. D6]